MICTCCRQDTDPKSLAYSGALAVMWPDACDSHDFRSEQWGSMLLTWGATNPLGCPVGPRVSAPYGISRLYFLVRQNLDPRIIASGIARPARSCRRNCASL